jgi:ElaB/YqjD/DUF883 family membrane-anchored ribosome-binding protein
MKVSRKATADLETIVEDFATLRRDVAEVVTQLKDDAIARADGAARSAVEQVEDEAGRIYGKLAVKSRRSAKVLSRQVEEQPIASMLVAFGLGYLSRVLMSRRAR